MLRIKPRVVLTVITLIITSLSCVASSKKPARSVEVTMQPTNSVSAGNRILTAPSETLAPRPHIPTPTNSQQPELPYIAFWSDRNGSWEMFIIREDGNDLRKLAADARYTYSPPAWSPDGKKIAYISDYDQGSNLMVIDILDGTIQQLTEDLTLLDPPSWSPDGEKLLFSIENSTDSGDIYTIKVDGSSLFSLAASPDVEWRPAWSPESSHVIYQRFRENVWDLFLVETNGFNPILLTEGFSEWATSPSFSSVSTHISFHNGNGESGEGYVMDLTDGSIINLTNHPGDDSRPDWAPDGSRLVFYSDRDGSNDIYVINPDGTGLDKVTESAADNWAPAWSPSGQAIAYISSSRDTAQIIFHNLVTDDINSLTNHPSKNTYPAWQP